MHEVGAVASAIEVALRGRAPEQETRRLTLLIQDPLRAEAEASRFYAVELLRERGLDEVTVTARSLKLRCEACGVHGRPTPVDPFCPGCGTPYRMRPGPAIVAHAYER